MEVKSKRGGKRPGAGRPKGRRDTPRYVPPSPEEQSALDYALAVMRDPDADVRRRDSMARALLSYTRGRKTGDESKPSDDEWTEILGR